jgi:urea transport system substrate-binding protein
MFKQAVEKLAASDITPPNIREAVKGVELIAPQGKVLLERENLHTWLWPKIAMAKSDGQFEVLKDSAEWKKPDPYAAYPGQQCLETGLVGA